MTTPVIKKDYVVSGTIPDGTEIRKFADSNIQQSIDRVLASAPPGAKAGIILYANGNEVKAGVFGKKEFRAPGLLGWLFGPKATWTYGGTLGYSFENKSIKGEAQAAIWFGN